LVSWLNSKLLHPERGVYQDGVRISNGEIVVDQAVYTYNQGPVLGALLELGGEDHLRRAALLVDAVARELTLPNTRVVRSDGTGDGGLFTGILLRYLALAARDERLPPATRETARSLVHNTAEAFWTGRREAPAQPPEAPTQPPKAPTQAPGPLANAPGPATRNRPSVVFSYDPLRAASETYPPGAAVELSTQLQAWMAFEAAATLAQPGDRSGGSQR
jgi:predicted alpha-1,6-mannanase (GH76 family)